MRFPYLQRLLDLLPFRRKPKQLTIVSGNRAFKVETVKGTPLSPPIIFCLKCPRRLTNKRSRARGMGPDCWKRHRAIEKAMKQESIL